MESFSSLKSFRTTVSVIYLIFYLHRHCECLIESIDLNYTHPIASFEELYSNGMAAYSDGKWEEAIRSFELAVSDYRHEQDVKVHCRTKCKTDLKVDSLFKNSGFDENLLLLYHSVTMRRCSDMCEETFMGRRPAVTRYIRHEFEKREPYNYLQFAYYQVGKLTKAAEAALTYLEANQHNSVMNKNFNFYTKELGVSNSTIKSMELLPHMELYVKGDKYYQKQSYQACTEAFEESLNEYYKALSRCYILCEYQHEKQQMSFSVALFDHFVAILECRKGCDARLGAVGTKPKPKLLQDHYHYLQYCYFEVGRLRDAAIAAKTYMEFDPDDPIMQSNMGYYYELLRGDRVNIHARKRALLHIKEKKVGAKLVLVAKQLLDPNSMKTDDLSMADLNDIEITSEKDENQAAKGERGSDDVPLDTESPPMRRADGSRNKSRWQSDPQFKDVSVHLTEKDLNGTERVAVDHLVGEEECKQLMHLVEKLGVEGDGYGGTHAHPSQPFTEKEIFQGVNVIAAAQAVLQGKARIEELELYLNISEKAIKFTQDYFDLRRPLYFAFTHLVCRTALPGAENTFDPDDFHLSHPVHSDNCLLGADGFGTCPKRLPAYTWRDYSAILYLNGDFEGGEFVFADHNQNVQSLLPVKCGRLVTFSAGFENLHGVLGVRKGKRCALPLWFTFSKEKAEKQRTEVENLLRRLKREKSAGGDAKRKFQEQAREKLKKQKWKTSEINEGKQKTKVEGPVGTGKPLEGKKDDVKMDLFNERSEL